MKKVIFATCAVFTLGYFSLDLGDYFNDWLENRHEKLKQEIHRITNTPEYLLAKEKQLERWEAMGK